jgi:hypothetical protein
MKIGAAGMNGQMPVTPHTEHCCRQPKEHPDEDRSAERRVTQVAFLGHALPHR